MKPQTITNRLNLPAPLVRAIERDPYNPGDSDISVTRLIQPPRKVAIEHLHRGEIVEDAADRIFALLGQISHLILERAAEEGLSNEEIFRLALEQICTIEAEDNTSLALALGKAQDIATNALFPPTPKPESSIVEKRLFTEVLGWKVSGQLDLMPAENAIVDYKLTSTYAIKEGLKPEWGEQINLLAHLAAKNGITIEKGQIVVILRDWMLSKSRREANYPQEQVQVFDVPIWGPISQQGFMEDRVKLHQQARTVLPECTREETWNGRRCADWCGAFKWCTQANSSDGPHTIV